MMHSVPDADRVAAPWPSTERWLDRLGQAALTVLRSIGLYRSHARMPELRMSQEWLEEHERQSRKHADLS